jgi:hypothetical protein
MSSIAASGPTDCPWSPRLSTVCRPSWRPPQESATDHLATIGRIFGDAIGPWFYLAIATGQWHPLLVMTPYVAEAIAADGLTKDDVRQYLFRNVRIRAGDLDPYAWQVGSTDFSLEQAVRDGQVPGAHWDGTDPERMVPVFLHPEWTEVIVAGNPGRNQSRAYVGNHGQGIPVTKLVEVRQ